MELRSAPVFPFVGIPIALVLLLAWGAFVAWQCSGASHARAKRVALTTLVVSFAWMGITWALAASGAFLDWESTPPPFMFLVLAIVAISCAIAFSPFGKRLAIFLPLWALVGVQAFRLPLELAMHGMYEAGIMPVQMSYSGRNFDIVTGTTALVVAVIVWRGVAGRWLVAAWNVLGLALLVNVVTVAILGTPRFQFFGREHLNVWVTHPPFVWLPAIMVLAALAGHLVIFRALILRSSAKPQPSPHPRGRTTRARSRTA
ncbi:MAG TPA: hypothetical protein VH740_15995 [Vicinamibacterales bacterium]|jgi:hypothetical protein